MQSRWIQRLANYKKALRQLEKFIKKGNLNELEEQGLIQAFECTHELAWNVMRDYLCEQGNFTIHGSRDATREALTYKHLSRIFTELDDLLLPYTIDLSLFKHIDNNQLIEHIHNIGKVFYNQSVRESNTAHTH